MGDGMVQDQQVKGFQVETESVAEFHPPRNDYLEVPHLMRNLNKVAPADKFGTFHLQISS